MGARGRVRMREEPGTHLDVPAEFFFPDSGVRRVMSRPGEVLQVPDGRPGMALE
jgi:hypothetical protein